VELIHVVFVGYFETWYTNGAIAETVLKLKELFSF